MFARYIPRLFAKTKLKEMFLLLFYLKKKRKTRNCRQTLQRKTWKLKNEVLDLQIESDLQSNAHNTGVRNLEWRFVNQKSNRVIFFQGKVAKSASYSKVMEKIIQHWILNITIYFGINIASLLIYILQLIISKEDLTIRKIQKKLKQMFLMFLKY